MSDSSLSLTISADLTLSTSRGPTKLESSLVFPVIEHLCGNWPTPAHVEPFADHSLPANIRIMDLSRCRTFFGDVEEKLLMREPRRAIVTIANDVLPVTEAL